MLCPGITTEGFSSLIFLSSSESHLFSRGENRLQVLDKHTGKPFRVQVHNAKGKILMANDLELITVKN